MDRSGESQTLGDSLVDELTLDPSGVTQAHEVERLLEDWIATLSVREREVLEGRFGLHDHAVQSLAEVAQVLGVSRERVRQIEAEALTKLRTRAAQE